MWGGCWVEMTTEASFVLRGTCVRADPAPCQQPSKEDNAGYVLLHGLNKGVSIFGNSELSNSFETAWASNLSHRT